MRLAVATSCNDEWLTPKYMVDRLGPFDLDPCSPVNRPWPTARRHFTVEDNGLMRAWTGRVWLNPPYSELVKWVGRMAEHSNGIALTFAKTDTRAFQEFIFPYAKTIFFIKGRIYFCNINGVEAKHDCGAASTLISYTDLDAQKIEESGIPGQHIPLHPRTVFVFGGENKTWRVIVDNALAELNGSARLEEVYETVLRISPHKAANNKHYQEKIRQTLQIYFNREARGRYKR